MRTSIKVSLVAALGLLAWAATPVFAQTAEDKGSAEADRASKAAAGDSENPTGPGTEHHAEAAGPGHETAEHEEGDPSKHFNFFGLQPGHLFDYMGKDELGGKFGDNKMTDPESGHVIPEEEPASPPFVFMLLNFALLLGLLAWKAAPLGRKTAEERHDLIKSALDEAAKLRQQAADKLAEYEKRLKSADAEIAQLVQGMRADAEADKRRILAAAETQAAQMKRDAELRIAAEIETARAQLTREVTAAAAAATEKILREKMTPSDQQNLVSSFLADVQRAPGGSPAGKGDAR
ncbi:MAG TPA: ATP synthase F0 subunit B [Kofleriaceae bacterium]|nr:ATP synthase F0 subunit B [Kofleriaceae bacterium]